MGGGVAVVKGFPAGAFDFRDHRSAAWRGSFGRSLSGSSGDHRFGQFTDGPAAGCGGAAGVHDLGEQWALGRFAAALHTDGDDHCPDGVSDANYSRPFPDNCWTSLDAEYSEQLRSFGVSRLGTVPTLLWDGRYGLTTALLAGFGRAIAEVGAVIIVGGNINHVTRVMTTTIALETSRGNFGTGDGAGDNPDPDGRFGECAGVAFGYICPAGGQWVTTIQS